MPGHITHTVITIEGNTTAINFRSLTVMEKMLDVNKFSFTWAPDEDAQASLSAIIAFKESNLGKEVLIKFLNDTNSENHSFKGIILSIQSCPSDDSHLTYQLSGKGIFSRLEGRLDCNSFSSMTLQDIISEASGSISSNVILHPQNTEPQYYTVQYNETTFDFFKSLAVRYGEWMFYNGKKLVFGGKPTDAPINLAVNVDIDDINIYAQASRANEFTTGYDARLSEATTSSTVSSAPSGSPFLASAGSAAANVFSSCGNGSFSPSALTQESLNTYNRLQQQSTTANSVFLNATSPDSRLTVGKVINITDNQDTSGKQFIITEISHSANNNDGYTNNFKAIPAEVEVPHYTNPWLFRTANTQHAIVKYNDDPDGMDRVKVWFPWMATTKTTQWIRMMTPHTGPDKGFRWIPEVDEKVMVGFLDSNIDRPVVLGAIFDMEHKSGIAQDGNNIKMMGTKSRRRIEINDDLGTFQVKDNFADANNSGNPINQLELIRKDDDMKMGLQSRINESNYSTIMLDNEKSIKLGVVSNGGIIAEIILEKGSSAPKITIHTTGEMEIKADKDINIESQTNINIKAMQKLTMKGTQGVEISGMDIKVEADTNLNLKGGHK